MKKHLEILTFTKHIDVKVWINYDKKQVSLVDSRWWDFFDKNWIFSNRWPEYQKGWHEILDSMRYAIDEWFKLLNADIKDKENANILDAIEIFDMTDKILNKNKKWKKLKTV